MADNQQLSLKWHNHSVSYGQLLKDLCFNESYSDATLVCHETFYPVHKMVLSNCSQYFKSIFDHTPCKHPFIVLKDIQAKEMELLLKFIYHGEVDASQCDLPALLDGAEYLQIEGLSIYGANVGHYEGNAQKSPRKAPKRKSSETQDRGQRKFKKGSCDNIDLGHLEPHTILQSENNGNAPENEGKNDEESQTTSTPTSGQGDFAPCKISGKFFCPKCSYSSRKSYNITRHIMRTHTGEKPLACHLCSYRAVETSQLTDHIERNHSGRKPFMCPNCPYGTITLRNLKSHLKLHEKNQPLVCPHCSYVTITLRNLKRHVKTHDKKHTEKTQLESQKSQAEETKEAEEKLPVLEKSHPSDKEAPPQLHSAVPMPPNEGAYMLPTYTPHILNHTHHNMSHLNAPPNPNVMGDFNTRNPAWMDNRQGVKYPCPNTNSHL